MQQEGNNSTGSKNLNRSLSDEDDSNHCMDDDDDDEEINVDDTQFNWSDLPANLSFKPKLIYIQTKPTEEKMITENLY